MQFILASASPRRLALLLQIGVTPDHVIPADIDETPCADELPLAYVRRMAEEKAAHVFEQHPNNRVLAADTTIILGRRIIGKPADRVDAKKILLLLSGRRHQVATAICLCAPNHKPRMRVVETVVNFKRLCPKELEWYLDSGEWKGKAGAYAIQGRAEIFVKAINGSFSNIVGLPLYEAANLLQVELDKRS
jgi:septum formation protein